MQSPWCAERVTLSNFRCFETVTVDFEPSLTVLVGRNGTGKTAVLDGLAVCLSPLIRGLGGESNSFRRDDARQVPHGLGSTSSVARTEPHYPIQGELVATVDGKRMSWHRQRTSSKGRTSWGAGEVANFMVDFQRRALVSATAEPVLPVLAFYGIERLVGVRRADGVLGRSRFDAYDAALDGRSDLTRLSTFIAGLTQAAAFDSESAAAKAQLEAISLACDQVLEPTGWRSPQWDPVIDALTLEHSEHGRLPLGYLATGIKITAGLVIDLASRAARANPYLGAGELLRAVPGIVMIDEVDLHLHPGWQQQIVPALTRTFPRVQFIVTTHSPQVLSTVPPESVRVLGDDGDVDRVAYSAGLRSDIVLRSILGTAPEPSVREREVIDRYMALVHAGEGLGDEAQSLRAMIEREIANKEVLPELADADAEMLVGKLLDE